MHPITVDIILKWFWISCSWL